MAKQKSMMEYMKSRASVGAPKGNLGGGGEDPIKSKKLEVTPRLAPSSEKINLGFKSKEYQKYVADTDKKGRRNANIRNVKKFGKIIGGGAATLVGGYYALTKEAGGKVASRNSAGQPTYITPKKRIWRWEKE